VNNLPQKVAIHPVSKSCLLKGHPWILKDEFTPKFPKNARFLKAKIGTRNQEAILFNDPTHPQIKARLWSLESDFRPFLRTLNERILTSVHRRDHLRGRENRYLVFGEGDALPGLFILQFRELVIIQIRSAFWRTYLDNIATALKACLGPQSNKLEFWIEFRIKGSPYSYTPYERENSSKKNIFQVSEFGVSYEIRPESGKDLGLFTDMSSIREKIFSGSNFKNKRVLNLFSYTGAFSLMSLKNQAKSVVSVDSSKKYLSWLERNLELNHQLNAQAHKSVCTSAEHFLSQNTSYSFDFIIADPPTAFFNKRSKKNSLSFYKENIKELLKAVAPKGEMILFLNTHCVSMKKFRKVIEGLIKGKGLKIIRSYELGDDCPTIKGFEEGSYLKGLHLKKIE
jgi:23S rRNA (cytosine1962-C5)-methyltransferase